MSRHELTILVNNIHDPADPDFGGYPTNHMDILNLVDGVSEGTSVKDITGKADPSVPIALTQVRVTCPDDASREAYEALDGTRYAIVSAETLPEEPI